MVLKIDARSSRELQAVILALKVMDKELSSQITKHTRALSQEEFRKAMAEQAETRLEHRVLVDTARVAVSTQNITLTSASVGRPLSGGLNPKTQFGGVEFGANRNQVQTYSRKSKNGGRHQVTRHTSNQLRWRKRGGYVFYPAVNKNFIARVFRMWAQTTVRTLAEAFEER